MHVIKRNGTHQKIQFDKITARISHLANGLHVEPVLVAQKVCGQLIDGIHTSLLDEIAAQICMSMYNINPDYNELGSRILTDNHIKNTSSSMLDVVNNLKHILHIDFVNLVEQHYKIYDNIINYERDFMIDYFGLKTLMKSYLLKKDKKIIERPQHMWMRVAIFLHKDDFDAVKETYDWLSTKHFTHASPTLYNAGTKHPQLSSCFIGGTLVNTVNRGSVPIENVVIGDEVVTHNGNVKKVVQTHKNKLDGRKIYKLSIYNTEPLYVTENHKLWSYNSDTQKLKWTRVDELTNEDFISIPNCNKRSLSIVPFSIKPYVNNIYLNGGEEFNMDYELTNDIMWFFGLTAKNSIIIYKMLPETATKYISGVFYDVSNIENIERIVDILINRLNISPNLIEKEDTFVKVSDLGLGILSEILLQQIPNEFYQLSNQLINQWLKGFYNCLEYTYNNIILLNISMYSSKFVNDVYTLCRLHNIAISGINNDTCIKIDGFYHELIPKSNINMNIRNINGTIFLKCKSRNQMKDINYEFVYTLGIEDDHSYSIGGIIAENCFLTTVEDSVEGIFKTLTDCALISKWAGGIGINISDIRGNNSIIRGTNGVTQGILPLLKTYNATGRYINQCFVGSTIIYTQNGPKLIKNIIPDIDYVLTSDGTYKKVLGKIENEIEDDILKIKNTYTLESIKCTNEHQIYISKDGITFEYISASKLCINDYMVYPIPTEHQDEPSLTFDICRLYGIFLTCSHIVQDNWYHITIHSKYQSTIDFLRKHLIGHFIEHTINSDFVLVKFKPNINNFIIKHDWIYPLNKTKAIHSIFLNLPNDKLIHVLCGILETKFNKNNDKLLNFINSNRMFIESIRYAFLRLKTLTFGNKLFNSNAYCLQIPVNINIVNLLELLDIKFENHNNNIQWIEKDNYLMNKVKCINTIPFKGIVYDLQIDENHNYTTHMGIVHNSGKRLGSFAMYIEPWHVDIFDFLNAKKNQGADEERARDLFYALWIPDLFMERVRDDGVWSLMCPDTCRGLTNTFGEEFNKLYLHYENTQQYVKQIKARQVWDSIIESQIETGVPYMLYKDAINRKSPQENIGIIKQSNLCTEIVLYTDKDHISVCNLASIALPSYIDEETLKFDFDKLESVVRVVTRNLNKVVDLTFYPVKEARNTNLKHRPIGIGIQGLADVFAILKWPFDSDKSRHLNKCIFECIYYASLSESCKLSQKYGSYTGFEGSPMSKGILQFDMWDKDHKHPSERYDWNKLKQDIIKYGLRNSTLLAPMPTASTSQILGFNECIVEGTKITDIHGISKFIELIEPDTMLLSYRENVNKLVHDKVIENINKGMQNIIKIQLVDGRIIECTPDHKFRVCNIKTKQYEWLEAVKITRDYSLVVGLKGIVDKYQKENFNEQFFNKYLLENFTLEKSLALARLVGYILVDGNYIDAHKIVIHVDTLYDSQLILHDLELLDNTKTFHIIDNSLNITIEIGQPVTNIICSIMSNCDNVFIPDIFLDDECPKSFIREFLAGYAGGDGISPYLKWVDKKCKINGCNIIRAVNHDNIDVMTQFIYNIKLLFEKVNIVTSVESKEYVYDNSHLHVFNIKILNLHEFTNFVGFRYNIHKMLRCEALQLKLNYKQNIIQQRHDIVQKIFDVCGTKNITMNCYTDIVNKFNDIYLHESSIPTFEYVNMCIQKKSIVDVHIDIDVEKFFNDMGLMEWFHRGYNIIDKTKLCLPVYCIPFLNSSDGGIKQVYDLNIQNNYSFIANGIVVHNCIEPFTSNLYLRRTLAGEFICINAHLIKDLHKLNLWNKGTMEKLIYYKGSVQYIQEIPQHIKDIYKTVWEIKQKSLIQFAADRGPYICQSQSLNLFFENPNYSTLTSAHFLGWKSGLKTGSYYIRSQSAINPQNVTIDPSVEKELEKEKQSVIAIACPLRPKGSSSYEPCEACSG